MNSNPTALRNIKNNLSLYREDLFSQSLFDKNRLTIKNKNDSYNYKTQLQSDDVGTCIETQSNFNNLYSNVSSQHCIQNYPRNTVVPYSNYYLSSTSCQNRQPNLNNVVSNDDEENTKIIDYKLYSKILNNDYILNAKQTYKNDSKLYWFAAYDKLIKTKKIYKILNYYNLSVPFDTNTIIEKTAIINDYDIFFFNNFNKPFIYPRDGKKIFVKLYLLNINQINKIFSYINRIEYNSYINDLDFLNDKNSYKVIKKNTLLNKYMYSTIYCLGSYMNINIYAFSTNYSNNNLYIKKNFLPNSNKLAKIVKALMSNFPEYNKKHFIDYLIRPLDLDENNYSEKEIYYFNKKIKEKTDEVNNLLVSKNRNIYKENLNINKSINSVIKKTITSIPTTSSILICNENSNPNYLLSKIKNNFRYNNTSDNKTHSVNQNSNNLSSISRISNVILKNRINENSQIFSLYNQDYTPIVKKEKENENENKIPKTKEKPLQNINDKSKIQNFIKKRLNSKKKNDNYYYNYDLNNYRSIFEDSLTEDNDYKKANSMKITTKQKKKYNIINSKNYCNRISYYKKNCSSLDNKKISTKSIFMLKKKKSLIPKNNLNITNKNKIIKNNKTVSNKNIERKKNYYLTREQNYFKTLNDENMDIDIKKKYFRNNKTVIKNSNNASKSKNNYGKNYKNTSNIFI